MPKKKPGSIHVAKNGAKYKIMPNGAARFISKGGKKKKGGGLKRAALTAHTGAVKGFNKGLRRAGFNIR